MSRILLALILLPALAGCQGAGGSRAGGPSAAEDTSQDKFERNTVQKYDIQTEQFQAKPPFGARSIGAQ